MPLLADAVEEVIEDAVVEEHLRDEELAAGVHLLLEVLYVRGLAARLGVALGIAGAADAEVALGLYVAHELRGVGVVMRRGALGRDIAPEREDVLHAVLAQLHEHVSRPAASWRTRR